MGPRTAPGPAWRRGSSGTKDPVRCALGVPGTGDVGGAAALLAAGNTQLKPEKSKSYRLGVVWDITPAASVTADPWQIRRAGEIINAWTCKPAVNADHVIRDPNTSTRPGDAGAITAILVNYINAASTTVRGLDLSAKSCLNMGERPVHAERRLDALVHVKTKYPDGSVKEFAGTHGNCDVTNCMGTPDDRLGVGLAWELGAWRVATNANYRGSISNRLWKDQPCANTYADGSDAPPGCKVGSFTTVDISFRWRLLTSTELTGSIQNLFDKKPPYDPLTYGRDRLQPARLFGCDRKVLHSGRASPVLAPATPSGSPRAFPGGVRVGASGSWPGAGDEPRGPSPILLHVANGGPAGIA